MCVGGAVGCGLRVCVGGPAGDGAAAGEELSSCTARLGYTTYNNTITHTHTHNHTHTHTHTTGLRVYTAIIDAELNEKGYIVPGLGDAGDRAFGTLG